MENGEDWVFNCDIDIKSEPDEYDDECNETEQSNEIGAEPSILKTVLLNKSLPYDSSNDEIERTPLKPAAQGYEYDGSDKFSFESDIVSLRSTSDYSKKLLEGIYILETQRVQAVKELDELYELQEQALSDPIAFVEKLQNHNVNFSTSSKIHELPVIDWSKYELNFNTSRIRRQQTKLAAKISDLIKSVQTQTPLVELIAEKDKKPDKLLIQTQTEHVELIAEEDKKPEIVLSLPPPTLSSGSLPDEDIVSCSKSGSFLGCAKQEKPKQRYKIWTAEEQKRLEELLKEFPPEEVETRRYEKIASFLEDRTPGQVAGRAKKYFKILKKHGIPVKDGMPSTDHVKKPCSCVMGPNPNTYLVSHQPSICNSDDSGFAGNDVKLKDRVKKNFRYNYYTFWTEEEQEKLDELLIQFPPEEEESSRWKKIAKHFKNRSPFQVASRVNYLKWLMRSGKFVPGKIPGLNLKEMSNAEIPRYSNGRNIMQYWTPEEQERLEELLLVFPSEKHENQRWKKIAYCLGNRTPVQVSARAKGYFRKCKKYGMPTTDIPGRVPRANTRSKFGSHNKRTCRILDSCTSSESCQLPNTEENSINSEINASVSDILRIVDSCTSWESYQRPNTEENSINSEINAS